MRSCSQCGGDPRLVWKYHTAITVPPGHENDKQFWYECSGCGFQTLAGISGLRELTGHTITEEAAIDLARRNWESQTTRDELIERLTIAYPERAKQVWRERRHDK